MCGSSVLIVVLQLLSFLLTGGTARLECAKVDRTRLYIENIASALATYRARTGAYPDQAVGLGALIDLDIITRRPKDAWGNDYVYTLDRGQPVLTSYGADGVPGGQGLDADISNRFPEFSAR